MHITALVGHNWFSWTLNGIAAATALFLLALTLMGIYYRRFYYARVYLPTYDRAYRPSCSVILPVKGICRNFESNLMAYCSQDYERYELLIAVESEQDPAVPVIRRVAGNDKHVRLVVAGQTTHCAQKNHNSLAAVAAASNPEVLVFGDADISPDKDWLHEMVVPLSDPNLPATTGFRWLITDDRRFGLLAHSNINIFMLILFGSASLLKVGSILWGGSMAIRKRDFDDLKVADAWARSSVDDFSMSQVLDENDKHSILVPFCITPTDDLLESTKASVNWFSRQIMFLKAHHRPLWWLFAIIVAFGVLLCAWLPASALIAALTNGPSFVDLGGPAILVILIGDALVTLLYPFLGPIPGFWRYPLVQPYMRMTHLMSYVKTYFAHSIVWAGVRYTIGRNGEVTAVERL